MKLTKSFMESVLIKAMEEQGYSKNEIRDEVKEFAYSLVNDEHPNALKKLNARMKSAMEISNDTRNAYVPFARALMNNIDYGFNEGETVRYWFSGHTQRIGKILRIDGSQAVFRDVILPLSLVSKYFEEPKQLSLF